MSDGVFQIDTDPPDLAARQADRVAEHQRTEAMLAGWTGDNWAWCGCGAAQGQCPHANCTKHRLAGIRHVIARPAEPRRGAAGATEGVLRQLAEGIRAAGSKPSSLPIGQAFTMRGTFRVYFNRHQAAPLVWCIATDSIELAVAAIAIDVPIRTVYMPKSTPDDEDGKPSAWFEVTGLLTVSMTGNATIGRDYQSPA